MDKYFYYIKTISILIFKSVRTISKVCLFLIKINLKIIFMVLKFFILFVLFAKLVWGDSKDEMLLRMSQSEGLIVYNSCILNPPKEANQAAICTGLYTKYINTLTLLNAPKVLVLNPKISPYSSSTYDICRFEAATLIFGDKFNQPYCPN